MWSTQAMNFMGKAFGTIEFCTLGTPVEGQYKTEVLRQKLATGFASKLRDILDHVIAPDLQPKLFTDQHTNCTHSITGGSE